MSSPQVLDNYLFLQPLIAARLKDQLADDTPIEGIESLTQAGDQDKRPRVIYVMWAGDIFDESDSGRAGRGVSQMVRQRWMVALRINNASQVDKAARNADAGRWLSRIHKALAGWVPDGLGRPFVRSGSVAPNYTKASGLFPLGFAIQLNL